MTERQARRLKKAFLDSFRLQGNVTAAARVAGVNRTSIYRWQEHDEEFAQEFKQAEIEATETLEQEAHRRAVEGVESTRTVYDRMGKAIDTQTETKYSDTLLIFLLKARAPEKYRDRYDVTTGGQPLQTAYAQLEEDIRREADKVLAERRRASREAALDGGDDRPREPEDAAR